MKRIVSYLVVRHSYNRTILELKHKKKLTYNRRKKTYNRTILELKQGGGSNEPTGIFL